MTCEILLPHRDKVFCRLWAWNTTHGKFIEIYLWVVHGLCFEESFLWDGDAYTLWALWYQPNTSSTEGSCCVFGPINLPDHFLFISTFWCVHNVKIVTQLLVRYYSLFLCLASIFAFHKQIDLVSEKWVMISTVRDSTFSSYVFPIVIVEMVYVHRPSWRMVGCADVMFLNMDQMVELLHRWNGLRFLHWFGALSQTQKVCTSN